MENCAQIARNSSEVELFDNQGRSAMKDRLNDPHEQTFGGILVLQETQTFAAIPVAL